MGFKIKKSILAGTSGHRKAVTDRGASLIKINKSIDKSSRDDGRAKSSAFQLTEGDKENADKWVKGKTNTTEVVTDIDKEQDVKQTDVKQVTPEKRVTDYVNDPNVCAEGSALWKEAQALGKTCEDWMREKTKKRDERVTEAENKKCTCKGVEYVATDCTDKSQWPEACKKDDPKKDPPKKEKDCHCKGQSQYSPGGQGTSTSYRSWEKYFCGYEGDGTSESDYQKHPNCLTQNKQQKIANADKDAVWAGGLGHDQGAYSDAKRKKLGLDFEGKYLGEGGGAEGNVGYSESTLERKNRRTEHRNKVKELENSMSPREWKRYKRKHKGNLLQK